MVRIAAEFGMTPSSRTRIRVGDKPPQDPFEAFLQRPWLEPTRDDPVTAYARAVTEGQVAYQPPGPPGLRAPSRRSRQRCGAGPALRSAGGAACDRLLRLPAPLQGRVGRADLHPGPLAGLRGGLAVRLAARRWPAALPHRLLRRAAQERQEHAVGRHRPLPAGRRRRAGRRDLLRRHHPRPGAHRVRRGQAHGRLLPGAQAPGPGADQQPARRRQRLALHAAVLRCQLDGRPERAWRDHRRAACPQDPRRGRCAGHRHRRQAPAAACSRSPPPATTATASASSTTTMRSSCWKASCRTTAGSPSSPPPTRATTGPTRRSGARPTRASASRSRRTISRARPRRRSPCLAPRTPSGACT